MQAKQYSSSNGITGTRIKHLDGNLDHTDCYCEILDTFKLRSLNLEVVSSPHFKKNKKKIKNHANKSKEISENCIILTNPQYFENMLPVIFLTLSGW